MTRLAGAFFSALVLVPGAAEAHMRLVDPPPINDNLTNGSSCGSVQGTPTRTQLVAGSQVNIHWVEVQAHSGTFRLSFSENDRVHFTTLVDNIPHPTTQPLPRMFSQIITVPNTPCTNCTIQFGLNENGGLNYVSCADVQIVAAEVPDAGVVDLGMPAPTPDAGAPPTHEDAGTSTPPSDPPPTTPPPASPPPDSNPTVPPVSSPPPADPGTPSTPTPVEDGDGTSPQKASAPTFHAQGGSGIEGGCVCVTSRKDLGVGLLFLLGMALILNPGRRARDSTRVRRRVTPPIR